MHPPLVLALLLSAGLATMAGAEAVAVPVVVDAGGGAGAGGGSVQWAGSLGGIAVTGLSSADYVGRSGWVGQLPEPATVQFAEERIVVRRSDPRIAIPVVREGDEEDGVSVPYAVIGARMPAADDVSPVAGDLLLPTAGTRPLTLGILPRGDGMDANLAVDLADAGAAADIGPRRRALVTILADPRDDGRTRPIIDSTPNLLAREGDRWTYPVTVDVDGLLLPHVLRDGFDLEFTLIEAPSAAQVVKTGPRTARVTWAPADGAGAHLRIRLRVRDRITGLADVQDSVIYTVPRPAGGG